jgi:hypothetical protein
VIGQESRDYLVIYAIGLVKRATKMKWMKHLMVRMRNPMMKTMVIVPMV